MSTSVNDDFCSIVLDFRPFVVDFAHAGYETIAKIMKKSAILTRENDFLWKIENFEFGQFLQSLREFKETPTGKWAWISWKALIF